MLTVDFERLDLQPGMTVLDAGCGQGRHSLELLRRGCRVWAVDLNAADLRHSRYLLAGVAREDAANAAADAKAVAEAEADADITPAQRPFLVLQGNAQRLPFASASFDCVLCAEVLEHVDDPALAAAELSRVLKPAALLAVSVPTPVTEWLYRFASDDYFNTPGGHVRIFTVEQVRALLAAQGFALVDLHCEHAFHSLYWWVRCVFGLHADGHPVIRHCRKILTHAMFSPALRGAERLLNRVLPKSNVFYARRTKDTTDTRTHTYPHTK